ncbi:hypothetical protein D9M72_587790 [compost metagenome]
MGIAKGREPCANCGTFRQARSRLRLIRFRGYYELDFADSLRPLVGWVTEWEDWSPSWNVERDHYRGLIVAEARWLVDGPGPAT